MALDLYIDNGRVGCPRRGDVDIDQCWMCPYLAEIRRHRQHDMVVCQAGPNEQTTNLPLGIGFPAL